MLDPGVKAMHLHFTKSASKDCLMITDPASAPRILIINDDRSLIETRRMLLESCGALVFTARGTEEAVRETALEPVNLVLIDATNVGREHGEFLCGIVKAINPSEFVALLLMPDGGIPRATLADRVIFRNGPRRLLVEINEILQGGLKLSPEDGPQVICN